MERADLREKMNQPFRYEAESDNGSQMFINMLLKAVNTGEVTAFADDQVYNSNDTG